MSDKRPPGQRIGAAQAALRFSATTDADRASLRRQIRDARRELAGKEPEEPKSSANDGHDEAERRFKTTQQKDKKQ